MPQRVHNPAKKFLACQPGAIRILMLLDRKRFKPLILTTAGVARTLSMEWHRWQRIACILLGPPWPNCRKLSTKTSVAARGVLRGEFEGGAMSAMMVSRSVGRRASKEDSGQHWTGRQSKLKSSLLEANDSIRWGGADEGDARMESLATLQTVSDMAQKVGGDWTHPMVQARGMPTS